MEGGEKNLMLRGVKNTLDPPACGAPLGAVVGVAADEGAESVGVDLDDELGDGQLRPVEDLHDIVGFGRIVASEREVPSMLANLV
jgi:hypothetical protein